MIAGYPAVTFEFWATLGTNRNWVWVFDRGSTNGANGQRDLYFCLRQSRDHSDNESSGMDTLDSERLPKIEQVQVVGNQIGGASTNGRGQHRVTSGISFHSRSHGGGFYEQ